MDGGLNFWQPQNGILIRMEVLAPRDAVRCGSVVRRGRDAKYSLHSVGTWTHSGGGEGPAKKLSERRRRSSSSGAAANKQQSCDTPGNKYTTPRLNREPELQHAAKARPSGQSPQGDGSLWRTQRNAARQQSLEEPEPKPTGQTQGRAITEAPGTDSTPKAARQSCTSQAVSPRTGRVQGRLGRRPCRDHSDETRSARRKSGQRHKSAKEEEEGPRGGGRGR